MGTSDTEIAYDSDRGINQWVAREMRALGIKRRRTLQRHCLTDGIGHTWRSPSGDRCFYCGQWRDPLMEALALAKERGLTRIDKRRAKLYS